MERRQKREEKKRDACPEKSCLGDGVEKKDLEERKHPKKKKPKAHETKQTSEKNAATRYISQKIKDRVLEKAGHQCEYQVSGGVRCSSRTGLQIDHILPFAVCHSNDEENLRVLCKAHNHFAAEEYYGAEFIEQKIYEQGLEKMNSSATLRAVTIPQRIQP